MISLYFGISVPASESNSQNDYIIPDSNARYLDVNELVKYSETELRLARNEIYARLGRLFKSDDLQAYFNSKPWYHGYISPDSFSESIMNDYEKKNAYLILAFEKGEITADPEAYSSISDSAGPQPDNSSSGLAGPQSESTFSDSGQTAEPQSMEVFDSEVDQELFGHLAAGIWEGDTGGARKDGTVGAFVTMQFDGDIMVFTDYEGGSYEKTLRRVQLSDDEGTTAVYPYVHRYAVTVEDENGNTSTYFMDGDGNTLTPYAAELAASSGNSGMESLHKTNTPTEYDEGVDQKDFYQIVEGMWKPQSVGTQSSGIQSAGSQPGDTAGMDFTVWFGEDTLRYDLFDGSSYEDRIVSVGKNEEGYLIRLRNAEGERYCFRSTEDNTNLTYCMGWEDGCAYYDAHPDEEESFSLTKLAYAQ